MNWKYLIGKNLNRLDEQLIRARIGFITKHYPFGRHWIYDLHRFLRNEPAVIVDAGANIGAIAQALSFWFPRASIHAFEPVTSTYHHLIKNTGGCKNIIPQNLALGRKNEELIIQVFEEHTISTFNYDQERDPENRETVQVIRLDEYLKTTSAQKIDILKIDVEGFEFEVLAGASTLLENQIDCIMLEVGYEREPTKVHFAEVELFLEKYGFQVCGIYDVTRNLYDKRKLWYSNCLYVKKNLLAAP